MGGERLKIKLKNGELANLYVLFGEEHYTKSRYCHAIAEKAVDAMESFNLHRFDAEGFNLSQFEAAAANLPLMSAKKCIIVRDVDPDGLKADEWKEFQNVLKSMPEECVTVLYYDTVTYNKKSSRWKTLLGIAQKTGFAEEFAKLPKPEISRILIAKAGECHCTLSNANAEYLIDACGENLDSLLYALEMLCAFTGGGEIRRESVDLLIAKPLDASIYNLARFVMDGRTGRALKVIDELYYQKEEPVVILSALSGTFCDLYRARIAAGSGRRQADVAADFNYRNREFRVRNAFRDSAGVTTPFLRAAMDLLVRADESLKSTRTDSRVILERLVVEIAGLRKLVH